MTQIKSSTAAPAAQPQQQQSAAAANSSRTSAAALTVEKASSGLLDALKDLDLSGLPIPGLPDKDSSPSTITASFTTDEDAKLRVDEEDLIGQETDDEISSFDTTTAQGGTVSKNAAGRLVYTPPENFHGTDSFAVQVGSTTVNVSVSVESVNDDPDAVDDALTVEQNNEATTTNVLANDSDVDGDTLTVSSYDATSENGGTVTYNDDGTFTYVAPDDYHGEDSFTYTVDDGNGGTTTATVNVTVEELLPLAIRLSRQGNLNIGVTMSAAAANVANAKSDLHQAQLALQQIDDEEESQVTKTRVVRGELQVSDTPDAEPLEDPNLVINEDLDPTRELDRMMMEDDLTELNSELSRIRNRIAEFDQSGSTSNAQPPLNTITPAEARAELQNQAPERKDELELVSQTLPNVQLQPEAPAQIFPQA